MKLPKSNHLILFSCLSFFLFWASVVHADDVDNSATVGVPPQTPTPAPTAPPPICNSGEHLDASGFHCVSWGVATPPTPGPYTPSISPLPLPYLPPSKPSKFSLFGYGPAGTVLKVNGIGVAEIAHIDSQGYFELINPPFPTYLGYLAGHFYPEICFSAIDDQKRVSKPVCIPPLSNKAKSTRIGPILLPPIISLEDKKVVGLTLPDAAVELTLWKNTEGGKAEKINQIADGKGNFVFHLPVEGVGEWRFSAVALVSETLTPPSNILSYSIKPLIKRVTKTVATAWQRIQPSYLGGIIICEVLILVILLSFLKGNRQKIRHFLPGNRRM